MRNSFCLIFMAFIFQGLIITGCDSGKQNAGKTADAANLLDRSGSRHGYWELTADSVPVARGNYDHGRQEGLWTYYYRNGHMKEEGHYKNGVKDGIWVEWYPDGEIMWKGEWVQGTRRIEQKEAYPRLTFMDHGVPGHILSRDTIYDLRIRISNVPISHLFVEVNNGTISRVDHSDHFVLHTSTDSVLTLAVGYIPDLQFEDFRNLVREYNFQLK